MAILLPSGKFSSETLTGAPLVGGKVYAYVPNTSTPKDTYTSVTESVQNPHPVILDARGEATIYWSGSYDVIMKDANGVTIWGPERLQETGSADDLEARLASTASAADGAGLIGRGAQMVASVAALRLLSKTAASKFAFTVGYYAAGDGGGASYYYDSTDTTTSDNGFNTIVAADGGRWKLIHDRDIDVRVAGAKWDDVQDDSDFIQTVIDSTAGAIRVMLPSGTGRITKTIYLRRNGVRLVGRGVAVSCVKFVNASGGIMFSGDTNTTNSTAQYESCGLIDFEVLSSGSAATDASIVVDLSSFSYSEFNIEAQTRRVGGRIYYGQGNAGTAPYFNHISSTGLFGGTDYSQTAFQFRGGAFAGGSNGPNSNMIGPVTRMASIAIGFDIGVGQGNLFSNICGESIGDSLVILGGNAAVDTGTSSGSNTAFALKDTTQAWTSNQFINGAVQITAGTGAGQIRRIASNTATQVNTTEGFATIPDNTSQYAIYELRCADNKFVNIRQEGLSTLNPDFIYASPDSANNETSLTSVQSLGSGRYCVDNSCSPKNKLFGPARMLITHSFVNPGASANIDAYSRAGVVGGLKLCGDYVIEWVKAECQSASHGSAATITVDCGGSSVGAGSPSLAIGIPDGEAQGSAFPIGDRVIKNGSNDGIFLNLQTAAAFSATVDVVVTICVSTVSG